MTGNKSLLDSGESIWKEKHWTHPKSRKTFAISPSYAPKSTTSHIHVEFVVFLDFKVSTLGTFRGIEYM